MPLVEIRGVLGDPSVARIDEYEATRDKTLPAGEVAYTVAIGEQTIFPEIIGAYDAVAGWAKANNRELVGPSREIYLEEGTTDRPHMEIAWPIR